MASAKIEVGVAAVPDATMLLQTTLLLNMHAEDSGGNEVAKGDKADHSNSRPKSSTLAFSLAVQNAKQGHQNVKQQPPVPRGSSVQLQPQQSSPCLKVIAVELLIISDYFFSVRLVDVGVAAVPDAT
eukprot:CAMPEP_0178636380 /NCGR_PEP_ID=MMETSP0698-20121128/13704_1 /TAXON_ID=265572 /ORGANISM="Extubocellulus spinifer, Strain CCMP396" /LENGTH=126 /DNA_ID=CAMNT_0020276253 /DNA_START=333 /DNA_END=710 /DNA_ORIENTATION=-